MTKFPNDHWAKTGGLAWLSSSEVLDLQEASGRGVTRSGRRYLLGRQFKAIDVGAEGEEARLASGITPAHAASGSARPGRAPIPTTMSTSAGRNEMIVYRTLNGCTVTSAPMAANAIGKNSQRAMGSEACG